MKCYATANSILLYCHKLILVIKYDVAVVTGDLWNGGTDANVYLTIYGERGDTGVRQLYSHFKDKVFRKGQVSDISLLDCMNH